MRNLTDEVLDEISIGLFGGARAPTEPPVAADLVPFAEWNWLRAAGHSIPELRSSGRLKAFANATRDRTVYWIDSTNPHSGFVRVRRPHTDTEHAAWLQFLVGFVRGARNAGLSNAMASQFAGVVKEMEDNIHAHSQRARSGCVAFLAHDGVFEFVVLDRGIGVLASLRQASEYSSLRDHGEALQAATTTGVSRFGSGSGRGWGFSDLLTGIANSNARARFRSGDHLLQLDGTVGTTPTATLTQRASGCGLLVGIRVHA